MRFQVPQFIETEEKIIGPFTLKQFIFVALGGAILFLLFFAVSPGIFIFLAIPVGAIFLGLALVKINEMPLYLYLFYFINHLISPKKYIYNPDDEIKIK
ncbi:MAG: hypothetical protein G01um101444_382 [Parcubacteria group bacterium Gr01-1014_44]|nr:MAG: hypothetical protein G01um101444_382 [Parcubacteria group bacterium Gr01-1014_44]